MSMKFDAHTPNEPPRDDLEESDRHRLLMADYRRRCLEVFEDRRSPIGLDELSTAIAAREGADVSRVALSLHHNHLPMMAHLGIVDFDPATGRVVPNPGAIESLR